MPMTEALTELQTQLSAIAADMTQLDTYLQLAIICAVYLFAYYIANKIRSRFHLVGESPQPQSHPLRSLVYRFDKIIFPIIAIILLKFCIEFSKLVLDKQWLMSGALMVAVLLFYNTLVNKFVISKFGSKLFKIVGLPILFFHFTGWLDDISEVLRGISITLGNISISAYVFVRVLIFGSLLFWLGRASNNFGKNIIRNQSSLDVSTREVFAKIFEVALFVLVFLLLLNIMGINLTALAVFGGALGVGLGFGLQSIASNFISGIIILLDRSLTIGDYIELEDGKTGFVREFQLRYTTLETYDGKDIMVPNEKLISESFINWSHKDPKQRYRVDFSVSYHTDIRSMVEIIKQVVAEHPKVISGEPFPIELQPDCEIDSFGDSGVNMFVEFWMEGIDDGRNRVGGDLLLMIFEALRENGIEIPFPQREVRILKD
ncbi:mechanosensitive ion channel family protein [Vibrio sp.]|uniref:mechanosensitive ion channel family protein n=1 Tax=Vibrio sp. TaxID=678 RepID=UPI003D1491A8